MMNISNTKSLVSYYLRANRISRSSPPFFDQSVARALAGALVLGGAVLSPTLVLAGPPVTVDVTVTGAGGAPVPGASVTVTEAGPVPGNPTSVSGGGTTGANGTTSVGSGSTPGSQTSGPLPAGVYEVEVTSGGETTITYINVPEGQTGTPNIDLSTATTINPQGPTDAEAARAAAAAAEAGDQEAYDAAVDRIEEITEFREQANEDLESAIEDFAEANGIRAETLEEARKMRKRIKRLQDKRPDLVDPAQVAKLDKYIGLLGLLEIWRNYVKVTVAGIPSYSYYQSDDVDEETHYALSDLPWRQPDLPNVMVNRPQIRIDVSNFRFRD